MSDNNDIFKSENPQQDLDALVQTLADVFQVPISYDGKYVFVDGPGDVPIKEWLEGFLEYMLDRIEDDGK